MEITSYHQSGDKVFKFRYYDVDEFTQEQEASCRQVYSVCLYLDKMVVVLNGKKGTWGLVGGHPESGEDINQTLTREVEEESNMRVLKWLPVGIQEVTSPSGEVYNQFRVVSIVEPLGEFMSDPAGSITEVRLINPAEYKQYFDWGKIGDRIIQRALELVNKMV